VSEAKTIDRSLALLDPGPMQEAFGEIDEMALETYGLFLTSTEPILAQIGKHLREGDLAGATEAAHSAKGAARMTGAFQLAAVCAEIEKSSKEGDGATALAWLALIPAAFAEVRQAIEGLQVG
jgi:HPt (histidine-containing phosphotransfer) domain-containing protein